MRKLGGSDRVIAVIVIVYGNTGPVLLREADRLIRFRRYIFLNRVDGLLVHIHSKKKKKKNFVNVVCETSTKNEK